MKRFLNEKTPKTALPIICESLGSAFHQNPVDRPDGINFSQIFTVDKGEGVLLLGGSHYALSENSIFYLPEGFGHAYHAKTPDFTVSFLGFSGDIRSLLEYYKIQSAFTLTTDSAPKISALISNLYYKADSINSVELSAEAFSVVVQFLEIATEREKTHMEKVKGFLERNYQSPVTLEDVLKFYPYSKSKLCSDFLSEYGMTIFDMLKKIRIAHAGAILIDYPDMKLSAVASLCGFNDESYFCKVYKSVTGHSPKGLNRKIIQNFGD